MSGQPRAVVCRFVGKPGWLPETPLSGLSVCCARAQSRSRVESPELSATAQRLEQEAGRLVEAMATVEATIVARV